VDKPIGLASYTAILSLSTTLLSRLLFSLYGSRLPLTFKGVATDFLLMPLVDSLYAVAFFSLPLIGYRFGKKLYYRFLLMREESNHKDTV
ncbi:MAG: hypothetical protein KDK63_02430, partial [Chlamydiia bacterium]|nr:hypothetical protein [Chlamydiia bacterium]